ARSAGPSTRSTTGSGWPGRPSTPRWRWSSWASAVRTCARGSPRCGAGGRRASAARRRREPLIRGLVADDQGLVRGGFRMILEAQPDVQVVGEAADGQEAVETARRLEPDVVLMDVRMPRMDGLEATRRLAGPGAENPAKVLILTTFDLDEYVYEALRAGA